MAKLTRQEHRKPRALPAQYRIILHRAVRVLVVALVLFFFFSSRRRHTRFDCDWSSDVCSSDLAINRVMGEPETDRQCTIRVVKNKNGFRMSVHYPTRVDQQTAGCADRRCRERSEERRVGKECRSRWSPYH